MLDILENEYITTPLHLEIRRITSPWNRLTWNAQFGVGGPLKTKIINEARQYKIDLTDLVKDWISVPQFNYGILLNDSREDRNIVNVKQMEVSLEILEQNDCHDNGGVCRESCLSGETGNRDYSCGFLSGEECCKQIETIIEYDPNEIELDIPSYLPEPLKYPQNI